MDKETAREIALTFVEAVVAPDFAPEALSLLASKKNLRLLKYPDSVKRLHPLDYKRVEEVCFFRRPTNARFPSKTGKLSPSGAQLRKRQKVCRLPGEW